MNYNAGDGFTSDRESRAALGRSLRRFGSVRARHLGRAISACASFESMYGGPIVARFKTPWIANTYHGIGHAVRVMVWSAWLAPPTAESLTPHLVAAMVHDTGRVTHNDGYRHGEWSAYHSEAAIRAIVPNADIAGRIMTAVTLHSSPDRFAADLVDPTIWRVLKDADGLDRARFGAPPGHCDIAMMRHAHAQDQDVVWMAYHLVQLVSDGAWGDSPCAQFARVIGEAISLLPTNEGADEGAALIDGLTH